MSFFFSRQSSKIWLLSRKRSKLLPRIRANRFLSKDILWKKFARTDTTKKAMLIASVTVNLSREQLLLGRQLRKK